MADPGRFDWLFRPQERDEDMPLSAEARFAEAFRRLSAEERSALALSDIGGLGSEEIATRMGTEREIVEGLIARARESIRAALVEPGRRLLGAFGAFQHGWLQGGVAGPTGRSAGAVAAAVLGIGAAFDGSALPPRPVPPQAVEPGTGAVESGVPATASRATGPGTGRPRPAPVTRTRAGSATPSSRVALLRGQEDAAGAARSPLPEAAPEPSATPTSEGESAGQVDRAPRLELVGTLPVARPRTRLDDVGRAVLQLSGEVVSGVPTPYQDRPAVGVPVAAPRVEGTEDPDRLGIHP